MFLFWRRLRWWFLRHSRLPPLNTLRSIRIRGCVHSLTAPPHTGTCASIEPALIITGIAQRFGKIRKNNETGSLAAPRSSNLLCRHGSDAQNRAFSGDAHRKSGVFSFGSALSPVESCSLQSSMSSAHTFTPRPSRMQAKRWRICRFSAVKKPPGVKTYLRKRDSRS